MVSRLVSMLPLWQKSRVLVCGLSRLYVSKKTLLTINLFWYTICSNIVGRNSLDERVLIGSLIIYDPKGYGVYSAIYPFATHICLSGLSYWELPNLYIYETPYPTSHISCHYLNYRILRTGNNAMNVVFMMLLLNRDIYDASPDFRKNIS